MRRQITAEATIVPQTRGKLTQSLRRASGKISLHQKRPQFGDLFRIVRSYISELKRLQHT